MAAASPRFIPLRVLQNGRQGSVSTRRSALNPLKVSRHSTSLAPASATSVNPHAIASEAYPIATVPEEHAESTDAFKPPNPKHEATTSLGVFGKWLKIFDGVARRMPR